MSKRKFMIIDLILLTTIGIILEVLGIVVSIKLKKNPEDFWYISLSIVIVLIGMFRWGKVGFLITFPLNLATCITYSILKHIEFYYYLIYLIGSSLIILNLLWFKIIDKKIISKRLGYCVLYSLTGYLLVAFGRTLVSICIGFKFIDSLKVFIFGDVFSMVIGAIIMMIVYNQKTILVDIDDYLLEIQERCE